jgi:hypothetical protein
VLKRTITYQNLDGKTLTEDFYFHYSTGEATELKIRFGETMQERIEALVNAKDGEEIIKIFRGIIADSIGRKSPNGKSFIKNDEIREEFMGSDAYSEMLLWLLERTENMSEFVNGIFPTNMVERTAALEHARSSTKTSVELPVDNQTSSSVLLPRPNLTIVPEKKFLDYTREELLAMSAEEFDALQARG